MRLTANRLAKLAPAIKEVRIHLCQTGKESQGVREFIQSHYVKLKQDNPKVPILIRECSGVQPRLWTRFDMGKESSVALTNLKAQDVLKQIESAKC